MNKYQEALSEAVSSYETVQSAYNALKNKENLKQQFLTPVGEGLIGISAKGFIPQITRGLGDLSGAIKDEVGKIGQKGYNKLLTKLKGTDTQTEIDPLNDVIRSLKTPDGQEEIEMNILKRPYTDDEVRRGIKSQFQQYTDEEVENGLKSLNNSDIYKEDWNRDTEDEPELQGLSDTEIEGQRILQREQLGKIGSSISEDAPDIEETAAKAVSNTKSLLPELTEESLAGDETPIGDLITLGLGIGTLFAGLHKKRDSEMPHSSLINPSYQFGINQ